MIDPERVFEIVRAKGEPPVALHHRIGDGPFKRIWWTRPGYREHGLHGLPVRELPLFGAELLANQPPGTTVVVVEGEPAALTLRSRGYCALATVCGAAATPCDATLAALLGFDVVLWPDDDQPGRAHMDRIADRLVQMGQPVRRVAWSPSLTGRKRPGEGADAADFDGDDTALAALIESAELVEVRFDPDASARETGHADEIPASATKRSTRKADHRPKQADALVAVAGEAELYRTPTEGDAYAVVGVNGHRESWPIRSAGFRDWLRRGYFAEQGSVPSAQAMLEAVELLAARARFEGTERPAFVRVARLDDRIYLDLADAAWRVVEIDRDGWRVVEGAPVIFRRPRGLLSIPAPSVRGDIGPLRDLLNVRSEDDLRLLVAVLVGALRGRGPFPVLGLAGEQGSAKTTAERMLRSLIDPSESADRTAPRNEHDLAIAARNAFVLAFDNLSELKPWFSDALARLATGAGLATRKLYSDDEETIFFAARPVFVNGITDVIARSDLLDRAVVVELPRIPDARRRTEADLWRAFDEARPAMLAGLLDAAACALVREGSVRLPSMPRMADWSSWIVAASPALGWDDRAFLDAYGTNRDDIHGVALEASLIGPLVVQLVERGRWEGIASDLLEALAGIASERTLRSTAWPRSPRALAGRLRLIAPNLRASGIEVEREREAGTRRRLIRLSREVADETVPTGPTVPTGQSTRDDGGAVAGRSRGSDGPEQAEWDGRDDWDGSRAPLSETDPMLRAALDVGLVQPKTLGPSEPPF